MKNEVPPGRKFVLVLERGVRILQGSVLHGGDNASSLWDKQRTQAFPKANFLVVVILLEFCKIVILGEPGRVTCGIWNIWGDFLEV